MPKLSVIVPVYKVEPYIHQCIDSILNQTFTDFELILVDDGSPDKCGEICDEYVKKDSRVKVIHKENGGMSDARNYGLDIARGEYIGFVDSDDKIDIDMYNEMLDYVEKYKLDVVCCDAYLVRGIHTKFKPRYKSDWVLNKNEAIIEILSGRLDNAVWNKLYKKEVIQDIRFPVGRIYEDVATTYRFLANANKVGYMKRPYYYYYKRKGSIINTSFNAKSRFDCFLGYKERLNFAIDNNIDCIDESRLLTIETGLATITAFYANNESEDSERFKDVVSFLKDNYMSIDKRKLKYKQRVLFWSFIKNNLVYKIYAYLSSIKKRIS